MQIDGASSQLAMQMLQTSQSNAAQVMADMAAGDLGSAPKVSPANLEVAVSVNVMGKVMDFHETIAMELVNMINQLDVKV